MGNRKNRRVSWRSYRKLRQVLFAFSLASGGLGAVLCLVFLLRGQGIMLWLGGIYLLIGVFLFGVQGILGHLDDLNRLRRFGNREKGESRS